MKQSFAVAWFMVLGSMSSLSAADNPPNSQGFQGGGASDLLGVTRFPTDISNKPTTVHFNLTCKDDSGTEYQEGQRGFAQCMERSNANGQQKRAESSPTGKR